MFRFAWFVFFVPTFIFAQCPIWKSETGWEKVVGLTDPLALFLQSLERCPQNAYELRDAIQTTSAKLVPTMVSNRGFHNTVSGSYSFFEMVEGALVRGRKPVGEGEFFFGHFTSRASGNRLVPLLGGGLLVEVFVFSPVKQLFNLYELIGLNGTKNRWIYRGDSRSILTTLRPLHRQTDPDNPTFNRQPRCAGCHMSGGPIFKELKAPHEAWWRPKRKFKLSQWQKDPLLEPYFKTGPGATPLVDAAVLAEAVKKGQALLEASPTYQLILSELGPQIQLRPLFCTVEINLESDGLPFDGPATQVTIPQGFFVDPRLIQNASAVSVQIPKATYLSVLGKAGARFPGTVKLDGFSRRESDHAWLTPVKSQADIGAIDKLVEQFPSLKELVYDVLAIDSTRPIFSKQRCGLLRLLPNQIKDPDRFVGEVKTAILKNIPKLLQSKASAELKAAARELRNNMLDSKRTIEFHQENALRYLKACQAKAEKQGLKLLVHLDQKRREVNASEISSHDSGRNRILENGAPDNNQPGFRQVFPRIKRALRKKAWSQTLTPDCEL